MKHLLLIVCTLACVPEAEPAPHPAPATQPGPASTGPRLSTPERRAERLEAVLAVLAKTCTDFETMEMPIELGCPCAIVNDNAVVYASDDCDAVLGLTAKTPSEALVELRQKDAAGISWFPYE